MRRILQVVIHHRTFNCIQSLFISLSHQWLLQSLVARMRNIPNCAYKTSPHSPRTRHRTRSNSERAKDPTQYLRAHRIECNSGIAWNKALGNDVNRPHCFTIIIHSYPYNVITTNLKPKIMLPQLILYIQSRPSFSAVARARSRRDRSPAESRFKSLVIRIIPSAASLQCTALMSLSRGK